MKWQSLASGKLLGDHTIQRNCHQKQYCNPEHSWKFAPGKRSAKDLKANTSSLSPFFPNSCSFPIVFKNDKFHDLGKKISP